MTLHEYAETVSPVPLTSWQKEFFKEIAELARMEDEDIQLFMCIPPRTGRCMAMKIIENWKAERK